MLKKISCLIIAVFLMLSCVACGGSKLNLVDFDNETITAELGGFFSFDEYLEAKDIEGNSYEVNYELTTSSGKAVSSVGNAFKVESIGGYKLSLSVEKNKRTITINVVDTISPVIRIGEMSSSFGYIGEKYELPQIEYYDLSKFVESSKKVEVYTLNGTEKQFLEIDNENCFTPQTDLIHYIAVTCEDIYGNIALVEKEFIIRKYAQKNEVESFSDKKSVDSFVVDYAGAGVSGGFLTWHSEYEGENGVLQVKFKSAHDTDYGFFYSFIPRLKMEDYNGTKLIIRAFVPTDSSVYYLQLGAGENMSYKYVTKGTWVDYVFDYQVFVKLWTMAEENPSAKLNDIQNYFAIFVDKTGEGCIYIDKIVVENENDIIENNDNGSNDIVFYQSKKE